MGVLNKISNLKSTSSMQLCHSVRRTPIECAEFLDEQEDHILCTLITATKNVQFSKAVHHRLSTMKCCGHPSSTKYGLWLSKDSHLIYKK